MRISTRFGLILTILRRPIARQHLCVGTMGQQPSVRCVQVDAVLMKRARTEATPLMSDLSSAQNADHTQSFVRLVGQRQRSIHSSQTRGGMKKVRSISQQLVHLIGTAKLAQSTRVGRDVRFVQRCVDRVRAARSIRSCNRLQLPGTTPPRSRARPCANGLADVSSVETYGRPLAALRVQAQHLWALSVLAQAPWRTLSAEPARTKRASKDTTEPALRTFARLVGTSASVPRQGALHDVATKSRGIFLVVRPLGGVQNCSKRRKHSVSERSRKRPSCLSWTCASGLLAPLASLFRVREFPQISRRVADTCHSS